MEITGKKSLNGFKIAMGPELWWGANPAVLLKYQRRIGSVLATGIYQEDLADQTDAVTSTAIPVPKTKKATLHIEAVRGSLKLELGGIWSGDNKVGQYYQFVKGTSGNYEVLQDKIESKDAFGGKFKLSYSKGGWLWYLQGASMGLVADGGPDATQTYTGWWLKDSGKGNQRNLLTGVSTRFGNLEVAPNFLWQKPLKGPVPSDVPQPGHPRNVRDDAFAVRENREMVAAELVFTYDPTPATWMYLWDSDMREDAGFAATFGLIFKHYATTMDAALFFDSAAGNPIYPFPGATPARDIWEIYYRMVSKIRPGLGLIVNWYAGTGEPNGDDERLIKRVGTDIRLLYGSTKIQTSVKFNDWGPYDYHKDHNLTFPTQLFADISTVVGKPEWFALPQTRLGVKATWRSLDEYSSRYSPPTIPGPDGPISDPDAGEGNEWEIRTYLHLSVGN
jgi:hypothetical protein